MKKFIKKNIKLIIGIVIGIVIAGSIGGYAASMLSSREVSYSNTNSKLTSTDVQSAIDELVEKTQIKKRSNIIEAYTYDQTDGSSTFCVTGEESTCVKTDCYKTKTASSCKAGDIIKYKVNESDIVTFHVMFDEGNTMIMQSQRNTIYSTIWYEKYINTQGPLTILPILESATAGWSNVNLQTYMMGTTVFKTNAYTGCIGSECTTNAYTLPSRTARARMITLQEAIALGCTQDNQSCPKWMNNYLYNSTSNGGTVNDTNTVNKGSDNLGYWTMSSVTIDTNINNLAWTVLYSGYECKNSVNDDRFGARAVVVINK